MDSTIQPAMPSDDTAVRAEQCGPLRPQTRTEQQVGRSGDLTATLMSVLIHAVLWLPFILCLLFIVPKILVGADGKPLGAVGRAEMIAALYPDETP